MAVIEGPYAVFPVKLSGQFLRELRGFAKLEGKSLREQVQYFLEVMLLVAKRQPSFSLTKEAKEEGVRLEGYLKVKVTRNLYDDLFHTAGGYGIKVPALVRVLLRMGLGYHKSLVPLNQMVTKEDFVGRIVKSYQSKQQRWVQ